MATQIPAGFADVAFKMVFMEGAEPAICTLGVDLSGFVGTPAAALEAVTQAWQDRILPGQSNVLTYQGTTARVGQSVGEPTVVETPRNVNGGNPNSMLTRNTAALVRKSTGRGGRRGRGRMFIPGILTEGNVDQAGNLDAALLTAVQNQVTNFRADLVAAGTDPHLLHSDQQVVGYDPNTGKPVYGPVNPGPPDFITGMTVDGRAATQRRRMR